MNLRTLSAREEQVMQLLADGQTRLDVAERLGMNELSVDYCVQKIRRKLGVASVVRAAVVWDRQRRSAVPDEPSAESLLRDFNVCPGCRGLGFVRKVAA
jgi:DNA-binding CsgD family transcriptional regulator